VTERGKKVLTQASTWRLRRACNQEPLKDHRVAGAQAQGFQDMGLGFLCPARRGGR